MDGMKGEKLLNVSVQRELAESRWKAMKSTIDGVCATKGNGGLYCKSKEDAPKRGLRDRRGTAEASS